MNDNRGPIVRLRKAPARSIAAISLALACGGASAAAPVPAAQAASGIEEDVWGSERAASRAAAPVVAGEYRLRMSAVCDSKERRAIGALTLAPISGADTDASGGSMAHVGEAALLWGQTDLDFGQFASCFGRSAAPSGEPIHPSVLVEVLRWDGEREHQVLLVSTDSSRSAARSGAGVAMWVESVESGHLSGVWSRWELMGKGEGRWEADLVRAR